MNRPTLSKGSKGAQVVIVQECLQVDADGDFGSITESAVRAFQSDCGLTADGIVGNMTWGALDEEFDLPPYPPPLPPSLPSATRDAILAIAQSSKIARYNWDDRGVAPAGYINGCAMAWSTMVRRFYTGDPCVAVMAQQNSGNEDTDVLAWYGKEFAALGMSNDAPGLDTLRHLFALQIGLGMRESSGKYCCGRDRSSGNTDSMTCEAGAWQMSWNMSSCNWAMQQLFDMYIDNEDSEICARNYFAKNVTCSQADWACYGSGAGYAYQELAKACPAFAAETTAVGLRMRRQHWGPINRKEAELRADADLMLADIQALLQPAPPADQIVEVVITVPPGVKVNVTQVPLV
jgi:hypothetical protein